MIHCVVIDDEPLAIELLQDFIQKLPFLQLAATFNEPLLAVDYLNQHDVDLVFLDIQMPDISGLSLFRSLIKKPEIVLVTAYREFALEGFEVQALDYLLKPVSFERFLLAANRAKEQILAKKALSLAVTAKDHFFINVAHKIHKIYFDDIVYLEGFKDYTKIYLTSLPHPLVVLQTLKYFEDTMPTDRFIRVHRSYIVSITKLTTISRKSLTIGSITIPVSDHYRNQLFAIIN